MTYSKEFSGYCELGSRSYDVYGIVEATDYDYTPSERGRRDSLGMPLEPDIDSYIEVTEWDVEKIFFYNEGRELQVIGEKLRRRIADALTDWDTLEIDWSQEITQGMREDYLDHKYNL